MTTAALKNKVKNISEAQGLLKQNLQILFDSDKTDNAICRISIDIPQIDIINWFQKQDVDEKLFWSDRDDKFAVAGIHFADLIKNGDDQAHPELFAKIQTRLTNADDSVRYFGGIKFDTASQVTESWEIFGTAAFVLPRFELLKRDDSYQFVCNINYFYDKKNQEVIYEQLSQLDFSDDLTADTKNEMVDRTDFPKIGRASCRERV